jgi:hypothetical protein
MSAALAMLGGVLAFEASQAMACPAATEASPGFRSYLPDCRAYELVTPPYKEGFELQPPTAVSEDGSRVIVGGIGAFAGSEANTTTFEPNLYELSRVPGTGWMPTPLDPRTSEFSAGEPILGGVSADLGSTLWMLHTPSQSVYVHDFYVRGADGSFTKVGPAFPETVTQGPPGPEMLPPQAQDGGGLLPQILGVSRSLTHIFYAIPAEAKGGPEGAVPYLWPGDTTVRVNLGHTLYEYSGAGATEPVLVGVKNEGRLKGQPHVNEGAELVSQCGTILGSALGLAGASAYNAISESGARVFFTPVPATHGTAQTHCNQFDEGTGPSLGELYVRENESRTILLTARSPSDCTEACASSLPRDANFEGASRDGSRAFFTSTQQLLNSATQDPAADDSAYAEGHGCSLTTGPSGCNLYEYDFNAPSGHSLALVAPGSSTPGIQGVQGVVRISADGSHVYFVANNILASNENTNEERAQPGADNLYVSEADPAGRSRTVFIARLQAPAEEGSCFAFPEEEEIEACLNTRVEDAAVWQRLDKDRPAEATPDGRFLVFANRAHLTKDDSSKEANGEPLRQLFEYDAQSGGLVRISAGHRTPAGYECPKTREIEEGFDCDGNIQTASNRPEFAQLPDYAGADFQSSVESRTRFVSSDGSHVIFTSAAALAPQAVSSARPGCANIYEYRSSGAGAGNVYLISDGEDLSKNKPGLCGSRFPVVDSTGEDVFFETGDRLVPQDADTQRDFYDARVSGGFPAPVSPVTCEGGACQGPPGAPPAFPAASTGTTTPEGNLASPPAPLIKPKPKPLTRAQKLSKALKACARKPKRKRLACVKQARKRYGPGAKSKAGRHNRRGNR